MPLRATDEFMDLYTEAEACLRECTFVPKSPRKANGCGYCSASGQRAYWATLSSLDAAVGTVRRGLHQLGQHDDTLILFTSDNGPDRHGLGSTYAFGEQLSGVKFGTYEGGIRVPGVMVWPNVILAPSVIKVPVSTLDIYPTCTSILIAQSL